MATIPSIAKSSWNGQNPADVTDGDVTILVRPAKGHYIPGNVTDQMVMKAVVTGKKIHELPSFAAAVEKEIKHLVGVVEAKYSDQEVKMVDFGVTDGSVHVLVRVTPKPAAK